jgi:hypothetical protein
MARLRELGLRVTAVGTVPAGRPLVSMTVEAVAARRAREGMCDCRVPLVKNKATGEWLHLATWSPCPNRAEYDESGGRGPPVWMPVACLGIAVFVAGGLGDFGSIPR